MSLSGLGSSFLPRRFGFLSASPFSSSSGVSGLQPRLAPEQMGNLWFTLSCHVQAPRTLAIDSSQRPHLCSLSPKLASLDCRTFQFCSSPSTDLHSSLWGAVLLLPLGDSMGIACSITPQSLTHSCTYHFLSPNSVQASNALRQHFFPQEAYSLKNIEQKPGLRSQTKLGSDPGSAIYLLAIEPDANFLLLVIISTRQGCWEDYR